MGKARLDAASTAERAPYLNKYNNCRLLAVTRAACSAPAGAPTRRGENCSTPGRQCKAPSYFWRRLVSA